MGSGTKRPVNGPFTYGVGGPFSLGVCMRERQIAVRLSPLEEEVLRTAAALEAKPISTYLRDLGLARANDLLEREQEPEEVAT